MDQDLIAYLDQRFASIDQRFQETSQQFQGLREETSQQIQGLREEFQEFRGESMERFERLETEVRQLHVVVEGMDGKMRLLGDGIANVDEKVGRVREEVLQEIRQLEALNRLAYTQLDARVRRLESASG